jgi:hypothetical protein
MSLPKSAPLRPAATAAAPPPEAAWRTASIVGVSGGPVDLVIGLKILQEEGHIRFAEQDSPGTLQACDGFGRISRKIVREFWAAPGGFQPLDVEGFLHRNRQAEQRPSISAATFGIERAGLVSRAFEIAQHDRVQLAIVPLDPFDIEVDQFE